MLTNGLKYPRKYPIFYTYILIKKFQSAFHVHSTRYGNIKDAVQSVCKQRLFGIQNIEFYSTTIYIFMILEYNKLSRNNNQALQEHKMK